MTMSPDEGTIPSLTRFTQSVLPAIRAAVNPGRAIEMARSIVENDRWNSFDRWHETSRRLQAAYDACGVRGDTYTIPTGGVRGNGKWIIPEAADIVDATVDLLEPVAKRLLDYRNCPWHVVQWSASTPRDGITCELAVVDTDEQFAAAPLGSLAGKLILTRLDPWHNRARFCAAGVAGLVCDRPVAGFPEAVAWTKFGWGGLDLWDGAAPLVGFAISSMEGDALRTLSRQGGRLIVRAKLDIRRYAGSHDVVSGVIQGSEDPDAEIWAIAHSSEPGALDNASGGAACVEICRALTDLIKNGVLPRPRRSIRLVHGYECYGFFHYFERTFRLQPPLAGVCIDTIGARPDVCAGELSWHATAPASAPFAHDIGFEMLRTTLGRQPVYRLRRKPFLSTEDTLLGDPKYGFPCPWITNHPCIGYHSSADTIDMIDEQGMAVCTTAMAGYLYYLARATTAEACEVAEWQTRQTTQSLKGETESHSQPRRDALLAQHAATIDRLRRFALSGNHAELVSDFDRFVDSVGKAAGREAFDCPTQPSPKDNDKGSLIPLRRLPLAPTTENIWPHIRCKLDPTYPKTAVFWADGERTLAEIASLASLDIDVQLPLDRLIGYFEALAELGFVELYDRDDQITFDRLVADFAALGIFAGMDVMVHSSMASIGHVRGGATTVIRALLSVLGPEGTLLAPTFHHHHARIFNPLTTPTTDGAIAEALWRRPDALRSVHPSHSVAAIGSRADEYIRDHLANGAWADNSPIGRLIRQDGHILSIGVGHDRSTAYHIAEIAMNVPCLDQFGSDDRLVFPDGNVHVVRGLAWRDGECPVDPAGIDVILKQRQSYGRVGNAKATLARAADVFAARREQLGDRCGRCAVRPCRRGTVDNENSQHEPPGGQNAATQFFSRASCESRIRVVEDVRGEPDCAGPR